MVTLPTIQNRTASKDLSLRIIYDYLRKEAAPVASASKPLKVVAPAVWTLHRRARSLQFDLTNKKIKNENLLKRFLRDYSRITDMYVILYGIEYPRNPAEKILFQRELEFSHKLVGIVFNMIRDTGGSPSNSWQPQSISDARKKTFADQLEKLRKEYDFPEFARKENFKKQLNYGSLITVGIVIFLMITDEKFRNVILSIFRMISRGEMAP